MGFGIERSEKEDAGKRASWRNLREREERGERGGRMQGTLCGKN